MEFLDNSKKFGTKILNLLDSAKEIKISSFGIYAGITQYGTIYPNIITKLLYKIQNSNVKNTILVSNYFPDPCQKCGDTTKKDANIYRLRQHFLNWNLNFYLVEDCHLKTVLIPPNNVIIGGINPLTCSGWIDSSIFLKNKKIYNHFEKQFELALSKSRKITKDLINSVLPEKNEKEEISQIEVFEEIPF